MKKILKSQIKTQAMACSSRTIHRYQGICFLTISSRYQRLYKNKEIEKTVPITKDLMGYRDRVNLAYIDSTSTPKEVNNEH